MNIPLLLVIAVTVGAVVFGVMTLVTGGDPGLRPVEPDGHARPLPGDRPLAEGDVGRVSYDLAWRGYRMDQVDQTLRRVAYDIGYKDELIQVLEAEVIALRDGRLEDADALAVARAAALDPGHGEPVIADEPDHATDSIVLSAGPHDTDPVVLSAGAHETTADDPRTDELLAGAADAEFSEPEPVESPK